MIKKVILFNILFITISAQDADSLFWFDMNSIQEDPPSFPIVINKILTPLGGQGGGRSENTANKTWLALDKRAKTNCFYNSVCAIKLFTKKNDESGAQYEDRVRNYINDI